MANFIGCKQGEVSYNKMIKVENGYQVKPSWIFFQKIVKTYKEIPGDNIVYQNTPVNIEMVKTFKKISGLPDLDSTDWGGTTIKGTERSGIMFDMIKGECYWYYSDEKIRDAQYEELLSNNHMYKAKVVL